MSEFLIALPLSILAHGRSKKIRILNTIRKIVSFIPSSFPIEIPFIGGVVCWVKF